MTHCIKRCIYIVVLMIFIASCKESKSKETENVIYTAEPEPESKPQKHYKGVYGIESGIIVRTLHRDGTREEIYFDQWGSRRAIYNYVHIQDEDTATLWTATINNGFLTYYLSLGNTYFSLPSSQMNIVQNYDSLEYEKEYTLAENGYMCIGTEVVENKPCKVWQYVLGEKDTMRSYIYKGILLRETEYKRGKHRRKEITTSLKENIKIPEDKFAVPENYTVKEPGSSSNIYERLINH